MKRSFFRKQSLMAFLVVLLSGCGRDDLSTLKPQGPIAQDQFDLMKLAITIMSFVVIVVFSLAIYVLIRFRRRPNQTEIPKQVKGNHKLELIWTIVPIILLTILAVPMINHLRAFSGDYSKDKDAVQVQVIAHQYWWEFHYPAYGITTAQELVIPTNKKIALELKTADVLHSFWVPSLLGKIDTNPEGNVNRAYFETSKVGVYRGKCAEFCGPSHGLMEFKVKAVEAESFEKWKNEIKTVKKLPDDQHIRETFTAKCLNCHAVGDQGAPSFPNLTGIGSREAVAGVLLNEDQPIQENIKEWLRDPQKIKPGNMMPKVPLTEEEIEGIAEYLAGYKLEF